MIAKINTIGALLIATVLFYGSTSKSWIYFSYEVNKLEIIEKFCVNKEVEEYTCEGKCHLMSQLDEADETSPFEGESKVNNEETTTLFNILFNYILIDYTPQLKELSSLSQLDYSYLFSKDFLRPPIVF